MPIFVLELSYALGVACALGDATECHEQLAPFVEMARSAGIVEPSLLRFVPDDVSALVRLGDLDAASDPVSYTHLDVYKRQAPPLRLVDTEALYWPELLVMTDWMMVPPPAEPSASMISTVTARELSLIHI